MRRTHIFLKESERKAGKGERQTMRWITMVLVAAAAITAAGFNHAPAALGQAKSGGQVWVATWGASPIAPAPTNSTNPGFNNQTVRMIIHTSGGGNEVRVRLSNAFGVDALNVGAAHIALHGIGAGTMRGSDRELTFGGSKSASVPPGALMVSDAVKMSVPNLSDLVVSLYLPGSTGQATWHRDGHSTNYVSTAGDYTGAAEMPIDRTVTSWFYLTDVEVMAPKGATAIVALGDSITDGTASKDDANHRWPNFLAERLVARHLNLTVVDQGIGGNRILHDQAGPNALARFDRDVLAQPGVGYVTVMLGINDIQRSTALPGAAPGGGPPVEPVSADEIIGGHRQMVLRAHQQGLKIIGCTLTPYEGTRAYNVEGENKRQAINNFIRTSGVYDGVIDFDAALRDPAHAGRLQSRYDSGDHLHPNDAGYQAMGDAIDLSLFKQGQ